MKYRQSVVTVIEDFETKQFVGLRSKKHNYKGCLVGGKVEKSESLYAAAIRECWEECGLVSTETLVPFYSGPIGWNDFISTAFLIPSGMNGVTGKIVSSDEGTAGFIPREDLLGGPYKEYYEIMFEYYDLFRKPQ